MNEDKKKEIVRLLGESKTDEARARIDEIKPAHLYKYRGGAKIKCKYLDIDALSKSKLWMPFAIELDDPYDCAVLIKEDDINYVESAHDLCSNPIYDKYIQAIKEANDDSRKTALVCSLSEHKDNIDMWIRYADYGKGFCIEYDFDELQLLYPALFPVSYEDIVKPIMEFINKRKVYIDILLKKTDKLNWKNQDEWRIIDNVKTPFANGKLIDAPKPKAIYLGYNIDKTPELESE